MPLKSREYHDRIKSMGFEKATSWAVSELIEVQNVLSKSVQENADMLLRMLTVLDKVTTGAGMIREKIEELSRRGKVDESHPVPSDDRVS